MIVFTNGIFDLIHPGHVQVLSHCFARAGSEGIVVAGINSDVSATIHKGRPPAIDQSGRALMLKALGVDYVFVFDQPTPLELIKSVKPDLIVKGGDYAASEVVGAELGIPVEIVPRDPKWSTTDIIDRIRG